jgi:rhodanese-related sulfurtransferase
MRRESFWRDAVALVALAIAASVVSNLVAGPERKLRWIGEYASPGPAATSAAQTVPAAPPAPAVTPSSAADTGKAFPPHPDKPWLEISGDDVAALRDRGALILDARRTSVYRDGHIAGARSLAVWEADADDKVRALFAEGRDQSAPVVVYCSGGECEDSHMLAEKLYKVGFDDVLVYKDGFPDWQKRGLPVAKGDSP